MRPSHLLNLTQFCQSITNLPGVDHWTAYKFDSAVYGWGTYVSNKLDEINPKTGKRVNKLEDLLREVDQKAKPFDQFLSTVSGINGFVPKKAG